MMNIFHIYKNLPDKVRGAVVAIGNFDGVHKGHQALLAKVREIAAEEGRKAAVLTFEPHPRKLFRPDEPPARLTPPEMKAERLEAAGIDILYSLSFDWDFASQGADVFIRDVLQDGLSAAHVVVGHDFRFGQMRTGEPGAIAAAGIPLTVIDEVSGADGQVYSSSAIRQALRHAQITEANAMLGWEWEMRGEVVRGDRRGHELGFPTANFALGDSVHPAYGVYAARVQVAGDQKWFGAAVNIGIRPMFEIPEAQVEAHIFDFDAEIYGKILRVQPVRFLRSEAKFASLEELTKQMQDDCLQARKILK